MRREAHEKKYPDAKVISLGIGDTTEPIPSIVTSAMAEVPVTNFFSQAMLASCFNLLGLFFLATPKHSQMRVMGF